MTLFDDLERLSTEAESLQSSRWTGTFRDFLRLFETGEYENMGVLAHRRIANMIHDAGVVTSDYYGTERKSYKFFEDHLYGVEQSIDEIMSYIHAAAQRTETARRMLLLYGPPSSGKSEIVALLKRGLEKYTRTKKGAIFALQGSKMHENPFLLVPHEAREEFSKRYGLPIEGELSPMSRWRLQHEFNGRFMDFPVEQIFLSEEERIGIGTWLPSDTKCLTENCLILTGDGYKRGREVFEHSHDSIVTPDGALCNKVAVYDNDTRLVYSVNLRGLSIEATANHRFMAITDSGDFEWVRVDKLQGRCVPISLGLQVFGKRTELTILEDDCYSDQCEEVTLPRHLNTDIARLVGYLITEGYCDDRKITFPNQTEELNSDFCTILKDNFGIEVSIYDRDAESRSPRDGGDSTDVGMQRGIVLDQQRFVDFMNLNFSLNKGSGDRIVPDVILAAPKEIQVAFLEGLYLTDGTSYMRGDVPVISFSSLSNSLVKEIQCLLLNLGVFGSINYSQNIQYTLTSEGVDAINLAEMMPKFMAHQDTHFDKVNTHHDTYCESFGRLHSLVQLIKSSTTGFRGDTDNNRNSPTRRTLEQWLEFLTSKSTTITDPEGANRAVQTIQNLLNYRCIPVLNIEPIGYRQVFDIEVDTPEHAFVANGLISHNSQDLSELVGSIDLSKIQEVGDESDPRAYNFDGELNVANRGIMEFIEGLKADEKFLRSNLTATQEKAIKAPRFGLIYVDTFIIMHTNEEEFRGFMGQKKYEAYHDRMVIIKVPYNLSVDNEVKIYRKLLNRSDATHDMCIAPNTLEAAAMFAVLTRMEPPEDDLSLVKKMRLYNSQHVKGYKIEQVPDIRKRCPREGMFGVSPRFVIDQISSAIAKAKDEGRNFVTPLDVLRQLNYGVRHRDSFSAEDKNKYEEYIDLARTEWNDMLRNDIQKAFFLSFEDEAKALCDNYIDHIEAACSNQKLRDPVTGDEKEPDEKLMDDIEDHLNISSSGKEDFRNEILRAVASASRKGKKFDYTQHSQLREAIQSQLFAERQGTIRMTVSSRNPDPEALKRLNEVINRMVEQQGYSAAAANELLKYATSHLFEK